MGGGIKTGSSFLSWTDCPKPLGPKIAGARSLGSLYTDGIRIQLLSPSARGGQFPPRSPNWPLQDRVAALVLSRERPRGRSGLCVSRSHGLKLLAQSLNDSGNVNPAVGCTP